MDALEETRGLTTAAETARGAALATGTVLGLTDEVTTVRTVALPFVAVRWL